MASVRRGTGQLLAKGAFQWFDRSYFVDWIVMCATWGIAYGIKQVAPFERDFDPHDPLISHAHRKNQISGSTNLLVAVLVPAGIVVLVGALRKSAIEIHHGLLAMLSGGGFNELITEFLKNRVGRLRPDFLSRCEWDDTLQRCTGKAKDISEGRRSFPSGHTSTVFAGMVFLALFFAGLTGSWIFRQPLPGRSLLSSRLGRLVLTLAPIYYAMWVAVSRIEDYRHHKEDVIMGLLIGTFTATTAYFVYWSNPFIRQYRSEVNGSETRARLVYGQENRAAARHARHNHDEDEGEYSYELAGVGHSSGETV